MSLSNWLFGKKLARTRRAEATRRKFLGNAVENLESRSMMAFAAPVIVVPQTGILSTIPVAGAYTFTHSVDPVTSADTVGLNGVGFTDPDGDGSAATNPSDNLADTYKISITSTNGTFTLPTTAGLTVFGSNNNGTSSVIYSGSGNAINTALTNAVYQPTKITGGSDKNSVTFTIQDNSLTPQIASKTTNFTVSAITPVNTAPAALSASVDQYNSIPLTGANLLKVSSPDATNLSVALSATGGTLKSTDTSINGGNPFTSITLGSDTAANQNALLAKLVYTGLTAGSGSVVLTSTSTSGLKDADVVATTVVAGTAPVVAVPGAQSIASGATLTIASGFTVSDANGASQILTAVITSTNGTFQISGITGLTDGSNVALAAVPAAGSTLTIKGTAANITAALNGLKYNAQVSGAGSVAVKVTDPSTLSTTSTVTVNVGPASPVEVVANNTSVAANSDTTFVYTVSDSDTTAVGVSENLTVTLTATLGKVVLKTLDGLTFTGPSPTFANGVYTGDTTLTFSGSQASLNAALNGFTFKAGSLAGTGGVNMITTDSGARSDNHSQVITVTATAPVNSGPATEQRALIGTGFVIPGLAVAYTGTDNVQVNLNIAAGSLSVTAQGAAAVTGNGTGALQIIGTLADVNATLAVGAGNLTYTNGAKSAAINLVMVSKGVVNTTLVDTDSYKISTDFAPVITAPASINATQFVSKSFTNTLSVSDASNPADTLTTVLSISDITNGKLAVGTVSGTVTGNNSAKVTIIGNQAQVNAALTNFTYTTALGASDALTITTTDSSGRVATSKTVTLTVADDGTPDSPDFVGNTGSQFVLSNAVNEWKLETAAEMQTGRIATAPVATVKAFGENAVTYSIVDINDYEYGKQVTEVQTLNIAGATSGQYTITTPAGTTTALNYNDNAATVQTALQALPGYGAVTVTGAAPFTITYTGVPGDVAQLTVTQLPEVQTLTVTGNDANTTGTFNLVTSAGTLTSLAYNISGAALQTLLQGLPGYGSVTVGTSGSTPNFTYTITYNGVSGNIAQLSTVTGGITQTTGTTSYVANTTREGSTGTYTPGTTTQGTGILFNIFGVDPTTGLDTTRDLSDGKFFTMDASGNISWKADPGTGPDATSPGDFESPVDVGIDGYNNTTLSELQTLTVSGNNGTTGGTFTITVPTLGTTGPLAFNDSAANVQTALRTVTGSTTLTVTANTADPLNPIYTIQFLGVIGDVGQITVTRSLTGTVGTYTPATVTDGSITNPGARDNLYSFFVKATDTVTGKVNFQVVSIQVNNVNEKPYFLTTDAHLERDELYTTRAGGSAGPLDVTGLSTPALQLLTPSDYRTSNGTDAANANVIYDTRLEIVVRDDDNETYVNPSFVPTGTVPTPALFTDALNRDLTPTTAKLVNVDDPILGSVAKAQQAINFFISGEDANRFMNKSGLTAVSGDQVGEVSPVSSFNSKVFNALTTAGELTRNQDPVLTFATGAGNFDSPVDANRNNVYSITVTADDGTSSQVTKAYNVALNAENEFAPAFTVTDSSTVATEVQTITTAALASSTGTIQLVTGAGTTAAIPYNATAPQMQTALQALPGYGGVTVTGTAPYTITFTGVVGNPAQVSVTKSSEVQTITISGNTGATGGTYTITTTGPTTPLNFKANAATVQAALEVIHGTGNVTVAGVLDANGNGTLTITFANTLGNIPPATTNTTLITGTASTYAPATTIDGVSGTYTAATTTAGTTFAKALSIPENIVLVSDLHAIDADLDNNSTAVTSDITYALSGKDAAAFTISATGVLSFVSAKDFEGGVDGIPDDFNGDNIYEVTITATDAANGVGAKLSSELNVLVTLTNQPDNVPVITPSTVRVGVGTGFLGGTNTVGIGGGASVDVVESLENQFTVTDVDRTDGDTTDPAVTFYLTGADAAFFNIDSSSGVITWRNAPNFEAPADSALAATVTNPAVPASFTVPGGYPANTISKNNAGDNLYNITVNAFDGVNTGSRTFVVKVINVNDKPTINTPVNLYTPEATSTTSANTFPLATTNTADNDEGTLVRWAITGGADAAAFSINKLSGVLTFKAPGPNFESPTDLAGITAAGDNIYEVQVTSTDTDLLSTANLSSTPKTFFVNVTDVAVATTEIKYFGTTTGPDKLGHIELNDTASGNDQLKISRVGNFMQIESTDTTNPDAIIQVTGVPFQGDIDLAGAQAISGDGSVLHPYTVTSTIAIGNTTIASKIVRIPYARFDASQEPFTINTGLGDDTIVIDTTNSVDPSPSFGLTMNFGGGNDSLQLANNKSFNSWNLTSAQGGSVAVGPAGGYKFDNVENITGGDAADNFNLKMVGTESFGVLDGGAGLNTVTVSRAFGTKYTLDDALNYTDATATLGTVVGVGSLKVNPTVLTNAPKDQTWSIKNIQRANITGSNQNDTYNLDKWNQQGDNTLANNYGGLLLAGGGIDVLQKSGAMTYVGISDIEVSVTPDVTTGFAPEVQKIVIAGTPISGTYAIVTGAGTTAPIAFNANAATVQAAIRAIGGGTVFPSVTVASTGTGTNLTHTITLTGVTSDVPQFTVDNSLLVGSGTEVQRLTIAGTPTAGNYTITTPAGTTGNIPFNSNAATVQAALQLLPGYGAVTVSSSGTAPNFTHDITFTGVTGNITQLTVNSAGVTGGTFTPSTLTQGGTTTFTPSTVYQAGLHMRTAGNIQPTIVDTSAAVATTVNVTGLSRNNAKFTAAGNLDANKIALDGNWFKATLDNASLSVNTYFPFALTGFNSSAITGAGNDQALTYKNFGWSATGTNSFDGGAGLDSIRATRDTDFTITDSSVAIGSFNASLLNNSIENFTWNTGAPTATTANTVTLSGWSGIGNANAGAGSDTLVVSKAASATNLNLNLTPQAIGVGVVGSPSFKTVGLNSSFETANITSGTGTDIITLSNWNGDATVNGTSNTTGVDTLNIQRDSGHKLETGKDTLGTGKVINYSNIDALNVTGGASANTFELLSGYDTNLTAGSANFVLKPSGGLDTLKLTSLGVSPVVTGGTTPNVVLGGRTLDLKVGGSPDLFENVNFLGAVAADALTFTNYTGKATIDGAKLLTVNNDANYIINAAKLTVGGSIYTFTGAAVSTATGTGVGMKLVAGTSANSFTVDGWAGQLDLDAGSGTAVDTIVYNSPDTSITLTDATVTSAARATAVVLNSSFETATLNGTAAASVGQNFIVTGWSNGGRISADVSPQANTKGTALDDAKNDSITIGSTSTAKDVDYVLNAGSLKYGPGTPPGSGPGTSAKTWNFTNIDQVRIDLDNVANTNKNYIDASGYTGFTYIDGGPGDDVIRGGFGVDDLNGSAGNDMLVGGEGNDKIDGDAGNDVVIGSDGIDSLDTRLNGSVGNDLVITGRTTFDNNKAALDLILAAWGSQTGGSAGAAKAALESGVGTVSGTTVKLVVGSSPTVLDDALVDVFTELATPGEDDWVMYQGNGTGDEDGNPAAIVLPANFELGTDLK